MIEHIDVLSEGYDLHDKSIRLLRPQGYERYEGREAKIVGKYADADFYYVKLKSSGKIFVAAKGTFVVI